MKQSLILEKFHHKGKDYEICLHEQEGRYNVWSRFAGGAKCDGYIFSVEKLIEIDARSANDISLISDLQATAKDAVINDHWAKYQAAVAALSQPPTT